MSTSIYLLNIAFCIYFLSSGFIYSSSVEHIFQSFRESGRDTFIEYFTEHVINHSTCREKNDLSGGGIYEIKKF